MKRHHARGQALIEYALLLPLVFLIIVNAINFGGLLFAALAVSHATSSAAQYTVSGPAYLGYGSANGIQTLPTTPTPIVAILTTCPQGDLCSLPNQSSISVSVCSNNHSSGSAHIEAPGNCATPTDPSTGSAFVDPEPGTSVIATVTVSYRYCPIVPFWSAFGINSTIPSCTAGSTAGGIVVQRTAAMRMIQ